MLIARNLVRNKNVNYAEDKKILIDALKIDPQETYRLVSAYLNKNFNNSNIEKQAWYILECKTRSSNYPCQISDLEQSLKAIGFHDNDIQAMNELAKKHEKSIKNQEWDNLFYYF